MIKYIHPVKTGLAQGLVAEIYAQIKRDFGRVVEPFVLHSPLPELLAGAWMACRETELTGIVPRSTKEAVAAAVSTINRCQYCVDAHTIMLDAIGEHIIASSINRSRYSQIADAKVRSIILWALGTNTPQTEVPTLFLSNPQEAPEIIGTAVFYHYINRMATVLLGETPLPSNSPWLKSSLRRIAGSMFARSAHRLVTPGESLKFLPPAELPADLYWAEANPVIAKAFARFSAVVDEVGERNIPLEVRKHVAAFINKWQGEPVGPGKNWIEYETRGFDEAAKSSAQLILLTSVAPWQIGEYDVLGFRKHFPDERLLLSTLVWGSFLAARKIGTWIRIFNA